MTYVLNLKPETARRLEERAKAQGVTPEIVVEQLMETPEIETAIADADFQASKEKIFSKYAKAFEVLAEGAK